jgi:hypothetical protein
MSKQKLNKFKSAVEATAEIQYCYQPGLQALGTHRKKIKLATPVLCDGSVEIDECVKSIYPNDSRWDYCLSYKGNVYFIEVHTANTREVRAVLKKLQWLKDWLIAKAPQLNSLKAKQPYYWVQSNNYAILENSPQARSIAQVGLKPISKLQLK